MSELQETPQFLISNLSLPLPLTAVGSIAAHERYVGAIGADGLELTPMRVGRFMGRLLGRADLLREQLMTPLVARGPIGSLLFDSYDWSDEDDAFERLIQSQHSSFRNDINDNGIAARTVPDWRTSLMQMTRIQCITGPLPAVLYPGFEDGQVVYSDQNAPFAERTFQPKANEWKRMGLDEDSSISDIRETIGARGFTGITWDVFHCQTEEAGEKFHDPAQLAARLAAGGLIRSVHLSLNRLDITGRHSPLTATTKQARQAFVHSSAAASRTLEGETLSAIVEETGQNADNQTETTLQHIVLEDGPLRPGALGVPTLDRRDHAAIIDHARELAAA